MHNLFYPLPLNFGLNWSLILRHCCAKHQQTLCHVIYLSFYRVILDPNNLHTNYLNSPAFKDILVLSLLVLMGICNLWNILKNIDFSFQCLIKAKHEMVPWKITAHVETRKIRKRREKSDAPWDNRTKILCCREVFL